MHKILLVIFILLMLGVLSCQEELKSEIKRDSLIIKKPFKAAVLSFFIPGGGQFYNENYLKSATVFALEGSLIGLAIYHHFQSESSYDKYLQTQSSQHYTDYVNYYEKQQSDLWWLGTVIFLSTIDAFVDAHLFDYEDRKQKIHLKFEDNMVSLELGF